MRLFEMEMEGETPALMPTCMHIETNWLLCELFLKNQIDCINAFTPSSGESVILINGVQNRFNQGLLVLLAE